MFVWLRCAVLLALALGVPAAAQAQSNSDKAAKLNDEGKALWLKKDDLAGAVAKFRQAIELNPEARYYFNLCYALHQLGRFTEALPACQSAQKGPDADDKLRQKAKVVIDDINQRLAESPPDSGGQSGSTGAGTGAGTETGTGTGTGTGTETGAGTGTGTETGAGTGTGTETGTGTGASGPGPEPGYGTTGDQSGEPPGPIPGLYQPAAIPDDYKWSLGGNLGLLATNIGKDSFGGTGVAVKVFVDFMWLPDQRIGVQGYLNLGQVAAGEYGEPLQLVDLGAAFYKHLEMGNFHVTPRIGVQATGMQSILFANDALGTLGARAEASFSWFFGPDRRHVISATPGLSLYLPITANEPDAVLYGLDRPGLALSASVGYTLRFTTPFGQTSLITLE